ncbi:unnamed protein product [Amoebophrya sp. A120]|nr:unnamed protein product [Amoebophrya sp. A120]|eukprot:GSA120T00021183001.1
MFSDEDGRGTTAAARRAGAGLNNKGPQLHKSCTSKEAQHLEYYHQEKKKNTMWTPNSATRNINIKPLSVGGTRTTSTLPASSHIKAPKHFYSSRPLNLKQTEYVITVQQPLHTSGVLLSRAPTTANPDMDAALLQRARVVGGLYPPPEEVDTSHAHTEYEKWQLNELENLMSRYQADGEQYSCSSTEGVQLLSASCSAAAGTFVRANLAASGEEEQSHGTETHQNCPEEDLHCRGSRRGQSVDGAEDEDSNCTTNAAASSV